MGVSGVVSSWVFFFPSSLKPPFPPPFSFFFFSFLCGCTWFRCARVGFMDTRRLYLAGYGMKFALAFWLDQNTCSSHRVSSPASFEHPYSYSISYLPIWQEYTIRHLHNTHYNVPLVTKPPSLRIPMSVYLIRYTPLPLPLFIHSPNTRKNARQTRPQCDPIRSPVTLHAYLTAPLAIRLDHAIAIKHHAIEQIKHVAADHGRQRHEAPIHRKSSRPKCIHHEGRKHAKQDAVCEPREPGYEPQVRGGSYTNGGDLGESEDEGGESGTEEARQVQPLYKHVGADPGAETSEEGEEGDDGNVVELLKGDCFFGCSAVEERPEGLDVVANVTVSCQHLLCGVPDKRWNAAYFMVINPTPVKRPINTQSCQNSGW